MDKKYAMYGVAVLVGGAIALWAGLSPFFLLFLVACPLMMFLMMRGGMHGGMHGDSDTDQDARRDTTPGASTGLDGDRDRRHH